MEIKQSEFEQKAIQAEGLVLVDFSATWCGPCRRLHAELEAVGQEMGDQIRIVKVDVDESPELAILYGVQGIPNLTFLKGGKVVDTIVGLTPKSQIVSRARQHLG